MKRSLLILILPLVLFVGCTSVKQMSLVQGLADNQAIADYPELVVQTGDELSIYIHSLNAVATQPFNVGGNYLVAQDGTIDMPILKKVHVAGKTLNELKADLLALISENVQNAYVTASFVNAAVSIFGEVNTPHRLEVSKPITLFEAIGAANGLTRNANIKQVEVLRTENNVEKKIVLDLTSPSLYQSPAYYLLKSDVVFVRPLHPVIVK